ncbi:MAG: putative Ig domain-containing protein, partial [Planctomycetota bacterium]
MRWPHPALTAWASSNGVPADHTVALTITDNHGKSSTTRIKIPVRDSSVVPIVPTFKSYRLVANTPWNQEFEFLDRGGHGLQFSALGPAQSNPPEGFSIRHFDGRMNWSPSADLLWAENATAIVYFGSKEYVPAVATGVQLGVGGIALDLHAVAGSYVDGAVANHTTLDYQYAESYAQVAYDPDENKLDFTIDTRISASENVAIFAGMLGGLFEVADAGSSQPSGHEEGTLADIFTGGEHPVRLRIDAVGASLAGAAGDDIQFELKHNSSLGSDPNNPESDPKIDWNATTRKLSIEFNNSPTVEQIATLIDGTTHFAASELTSLSALVTQDTEAILHRKQLQTDVDLRVHLSLDGEGLPQYGQVIRFTVQDPTLFDPYKPEFDLTHLPPNTAVVDQTMVYQPRLQIPTQEIHQGQSVIWALEDAPDGMQIDSRTGELHWTAGEELLDHEFNVTVRVSSAQGAGSTQSFKVQVKSANSAPVFQTTFPTKWEAGTNVVFDALAHDPENHALGFDLLPIANGSIPNGLTIDSSSGHVRWIAPPQGEFEFYIRAYEIENEQSSVQTKVKLVIVDELVNLEPLIQGNPSGGLVSIGHEFEFQFTISDQDQPEDTGEEQNNFKKKYGYQIQSASNLAGVAISDYGLFTWTPTADQEGLQTFRLAVTDESPHASVANNTRFLTFQLEAYQNTAPEITSASLLSANVATTLVHQIVATDADGDDLTYVLRRDSGIEDGMQLDPETGVFRWQTPDSFETKTYSDVVVEVIDRYGAKATQSLSIAVDVADITPPTLNVYLKGPDGDIVLPSDEIQADQVSEYDIWLEVRDNRGILLPEDPDHPGDRQNGSWFISANNTGASEVSLGVELSDYTTNGMHDSDDPLAKADKHGLWKVDLTGGLNQGILEIYVEGYDEARNKVDRYLRFYVNDDDAHQTAKILNYNQDSPPITDRFEVRGNANYSDSFGLGVYDLKLTSMEDPSDFVYLAKNEPAIRTSDPDEPNGDTLIGVVDGTQIPTGQYRLYLEVRCAQACIKAVDERIIEVQNEARLGNLELADSDLNVTLGGVPIPLIRTYNSGLTGEIDEEGGGALDYDFSPGWQLNFLQSELSVSHPHGVTTGLGEAFAHGTRVFATLPDGSVHRFTFDPIEYGGVHIPNLNPDPEFDSQLYLKDFDESVRFVLNEERKDGTYISVNDGLDSNPAHFGSEWILQTENGLEYHYDIHTGQLISIEDANDAKILIERVETDEGDQIVIKTLNTGSDNEEETYDQSGGNNNQDEEPVPALIVNREEYLAAQILQNTNVNQPVRFQLAGMAADEKWYVIGRNGRIYGAFNDSNPDGESGEQKAIALAWENGETKFRVVSVVDPTKEGNSDAEDRVVSYLYGSYQPKDVLAEQPALVDESAGDLLAQVQHRDNTTVSYGYTDGVFQYHLTEMYDNFDENADLDKLDKAGGDKVFEATYYTANAA